MYCCKPITLNNGKQVGCRFCWACRKARVRDWVGRCIAEHETSAAASSVTLTYGRDERGEVDHVKALLLNYRDVQLYVKRLRKNGYPCRFLAVGEYGSMKARAHWHVLIFWKRQAPAFRGGELLELPGGGQAVADAGEPYPFGQRFAERHWPHGFSYWDDFGVKSVRYAVKYITKAIDPRQCEQFVMRCSKVPMLGADYFTDRARRYVEQGLAPQDGRYKFSDIVDRKGRVLEFTLQRHSLDHFLSSYLAHWRAAHGDAHPPSSPLLEDWCDEQAARRPDMEWTPAPKMRKGPAGNPLPYPVFKPDGAGAIAFSDSLNAYFAVVDGVRLFWMLDGTGAPAWLRQIVPIPELRRRAARGARLADPERYRQAKAGSSPVAEAGRGKRSRRVLPIRTRSPLIPHS